ncbi:MAG: hypothetical protein F6K62_11640 [Sphaerospermopsis sp. SIO1G2]|nr:hypothetical protein [Sphaerospermopsis sp. SIO1G2]
MSLVDCALFTFFNTIACLTFPRILSVILVDQKKSSAKVPEKIDADVKIPAPGAKPEVVSLL